MTRRTKTEIKNEAKACVSHHGAWPVLEFSALEFLNDYDGTWSDADKEALVIEANNQANRVLDFLRVGLD